MTTDDDRLPPEILDAYAVPEPSADLADRFAARLATPRPRRRWSLAAGIAGIAIAAAAAIALVVLRHGPEPQSGRASPTRRTTVALADRGVAVAEPGARVEWTVASNGDARIDQAAGNVFYRVEHGGVFVVTTPVGDVTVHGTCFRVELETTTTGASLAMTVYEGTVTVANRHGQLDATAGATVAVTVATAPHLAPSSIAQAPAPDVTVAGLVARDRAQRERIAALEARLARVAPTDSPKPFEMSPTELGELAKHCSVPIDVPPLAGSTLVDKRTQEGLRDAGFSEAERAAVERVTGRLQPAYTADMQALYHELTGEDVDLDPLTLIVEIAQKSTPDDVATAHQIIAAERAGLRPPPADPRAGSVMERYLRRAIAAADTFERELATEIGPGRARDLRRTWGTFNLEPGCPPEKTP